MTRALRLIWLAALAAVIAGSVLPAQSAAMSLIDRAGINDKVEHFTAYAVLAALPSLNHFRCRRLRATLAFLFLLGALLELAQLFSPGRTLMACLIVLNPMTKDKEPTIPAKR